MGDIGRPLQTVRRWGAPLYDFDGLRAFKAKLRPRSWDPIYLSYPPGGTAWRAVWDTLKAFAHGGLLGFGIRTLLRGPAIAMRVLAVLLVPWTILLALPVSRPWFPSETVRWGWVVFDVVVVVALYRLSERWRPRVALALTTVIALDAALTVWQGIAFDLPRHHTAIGVGIIAAAVFAPTLAAGLLWTGRSHRRSIAGSAD
jgi:phosphatidylglycerol lysyltransferase